LTGAFYILFEQPVGVRPVWGLGWAQVAGGKVAAGAMHIRYHTRIIKIIDV